MAVEKGRPGTVPGRLRIIGGAWRGRRFPVPAVQHLRPTPDRVRETLFNWLHGKLTGSICVDLFAGSGALGLEALSRGAAATTFIDQNRLACESIRAVLRQLDATDRGKVQCTEASSWLGSYSGPPVDIVFIDPPFASGLALPTLAQLDTCGVLDRDARVYLEQATTDPATALPQGWNLLREKQAGNVQYRLIAPA